MLECAYKTACHIVISCEDEMIKSVWSATCCVGVSSLSPKQQVIWLFLRNYSHLLFLNIEFTRIVAWERDEIKGELMVKRNMYTYLYDTCCWVQTYVWLATWEIGSIILKPKDIIYYFNIIFIRQKFPSNNLHEIEESFFFFFRLRFVYFWSIVVEASYILCLFFCFYT